MTSCDDRQTAFFESQVEHGTNYGQLDKLVLANKELTDQLQMLAKENKQLKINQHHLSMEDSNFSFAPEESLRKEIDVLKKENSELKSRVIQNSSQLGDQSSIHDFKASVDLMTAQSKIDKLKSHNHFLQSSLAEAQSLEVENRDLSSQLIEMQSRQSRVEEDHQREILDLQQSLMESDGKRIGLQEQMIQQKLRAKDLEAKLIQLQEVLQNMSIHNSRGDSMDIHPFTADRITELSVDALPSFEIIPSFKKSGDSEVVNAGLKSALRRSTSRKTVKFDEKVKSNTLQPSEVVYILPDGRRVDEDEYNEIKARKQSESKRIMNEIQAATNKAEAVIGASYDHGSLRENDFEHKSEIKRPPINPNIVSRGHPREETLIEDDGRIRIRSSRKSHQRDDDRTDDRSERDASYSRDRDHHSRKHKKDSKRKHKRPEEPPSKYAELFSINYQSTSQGTIRPHTYNQVQTAKLHYPAQYLANTYTQQAIDSHDNSKLTDIRHAVSPLSSVGFDRNHEFNTQSSGFVFTADGQADRNIETRADQFGSQERVAIQETSKTEKKSDISDDFDIKAMVRDGMRKVFAEHGFDPYEQENRQASTLKDFDMNRKQEDTPSQQNSPPKPSITLAANHSKIPSDISSRSIAGMHRDSNSRPSGGIDTMKLIEGYQSSYSSSYFSRPV